MKRWLKQPSVITRKAGNSNAGGILALPGSGFKVHRSSREREVREVPRDAAVSGEEDAVQDPFEFFGPFGDLPILGAHGFAMPE